MNLRVTLIGAGNVASWFAFIIRKQGGTISQVYSRNIVHADTLAKQYGGISIDHPDQLTEGSDLYLFSLKDDVYESLLPLLPRTLPFAAHTAGALPADIFAGYAEHFGVIYPYQSISKSNSFEGLTVPLCIEGSDKTTEQQLLNYAINWSSYVYPVDSIQRARLHLAAAFASNFTNALYGIGYKLLEEYRIDPMIMMPLLENTLKKIGSMSPEEAQTGPAIRQDKKTMEKHLEMLSDERLRELYRLMSNIIQQNALD